MAQRMRRMERGAWLEGLTEDTVTSIMKLRSESSEWQPEVGSVGWRRKLYRLQETRQTEQIQSELDRLQAVRDDDSEQKRTRRDAAERMVFLSNEMALAVQRDAIQATREPSCGCLGLGGFHEVGLPVLDRPEDEADWPMSWREFCTCAEGIAAVQKHREYMERYREETQARTTMRMLKDSGLGRYKGQTLESYLDRVAQKVGWIPSANEDYVVQLRAWAAGLDDWLYLHGPFGTGKTGLLASLAQMAIAAGEKSVVLITVPDVLARIQATFSKHAEGEPTTEDVVTAFRNCSLLLLDDLGQQYGTPWANAQLWALINDRYKASRQTAISSNMSPLELARKHGEGLAGRIFEDCLVVEIAGPNLRDSDAE